MDDAGRHAEGVSRLAELLPLARQDAALSRGRPITRTTESLAAARGLDAGNGKALYLDRSGDGWSASLVVEPVQGTPALEIRTPPQQCSAAQAADNARSLLAGLLMLLAGPGTPEFLIGGVGFPLAQAVLDRIRLEAEPPPRGHDSKAAATRRLQDLLGLHFPHGFTMAAYGELAADQRRFLAAAIYRAASLGIWKLP